MNRPTQDSNANLASAVQQSVAVAELISSIQNSQGLVNLAALTAELALSPDQLALILPYLDEDLSLEDLAVICGRRG